MSCAHRFWSRLATGSGALLLLGAAPLARAVVLSRSVCDDHAKDVFCSQPGVVWCGSDAELAMDRLARAAAPILWFSPDEPLLRAPTPGSAGGNSGRFVDLPQKLQVVDPHHCLLDRSGCNDDPERRAHVYWRVTRFLVRDGMQARVEAALARGQLDVAAIDSLTLAYFFYYERDEGLDPHYNDTESVELSIDFEPAPRSPARTAAPRYRALVARVTGLAHGSELLSNVLQIKKSLKLHAVASDVTLPITVLVEEGKHASAPDRNGDGTYTPGYDVNVNVNDAWGVRDVFGSGVVASRYRESMTKPRNPDDRVGPDARWFDAYGSDFPAPAQCYETRGALSLPKQVYELEPAPQCAKGDPDPFCGTTRALVKERPGAGEFYKDRCLGGPVASRSAAERGKKPDECNFLNMAYAQRAFTQHDLTAFRLKYYYGPYWILQPFRYLAPAVRVEGNGVGPQLTWFLPFGLPKFGGWFAARGALVKDAGEWEWRVDLSHTPSLSRIADWYAAVGYDWGVTSDRQEADGSGPERRDGWAAEAGVQIRFRAWWVRAGTRLSLSGGMLSRARVVAELGHGPQPKDARVH